MISIFLFLKHEKDVIFVFFQFYEKYAWKIFRIWSYAWNKIFVFAFEKGNWFKSFGHFFLKYFEENQVF